MTLATAAATSSAGCGHSNRGGFRFSHHNPVNAPVPLSKVIECTAGGRTFTVDSAADCYSETPCPAGQHVHGNVCGSGAGHVEPDCPTDNTAAVTLTWTGHASGYDVDMSKTCPVQACESGRHPHGTPPACEANHPARAACGVGNAGQTVRWTYHNARGENAQGAEACPNPALQQRPVCSASFHNHASAVPGGHSGCQTAHRAPACVRGGGTWRPRHAAGSPGHLAATGLPACVSTRGICRDTASGDMFYVTRAQGTTRAWPGSHGGAQARFGATAQYSAGGGAWVTGSRTAEKLSLPEGSWLYVSLAYPTGAASGTRGVPFYGDDWVVSGDDWVQRFYLCGYLKWRIASATVTLTGPAAANIAAQTYTYRTNSDGDEVIGPGAAVTLPASECKTSGRTGRCPTRFRLRASAPTPARCGAAGYEATLSVTVRWERTISRNYSMPDRTDYVVIDGPSQAIKIACDGDAAVRACSAIDALSDSAVAVRALHSGGAAAMTPTLEAVSPLPHTYWAPAGPGWSAAGIGPLPAGGQFAVRGRVHREPARAWNGELVPGRWTYGPHATEVRADSRPAAPVCARVVWRLARTRWSVLERVGGETRPAPASALPLLSLPADIDCPAGNFNGYPNNCRKNSRGYVTEYRSMRIQEPAAGTAQDIRDRACGSADYPDPGDPPSRITTEAGRREWRLERFEVWPGAYSPGRRNGWIVADCRGGRIMAISVGAVAPGCGAREYVLVFEAHHHAAVYRVPDNGSGRFSSLVDGSGGGFVGRSARMEVEVAVSPPPDNPLCAVGSI